MKIWLKGKRDDEEELFFVTANSICFHEKKQLNVTEQHFEA